LLWQLEGYDRQPSGISLFEGGLRGRKLPGSRTTFPEQHMYWNPECHREGEGVIFIPAEEISAGRTWLLSFPLGWAKTDLRDWRNGSSRRAPA
jgi:hypothetical protein